MEVRGKRQLAASGMCSNEGPNPNPGAARAESTGNPSLWGRSPNQLSHTSQGWDVYLCYLVATAEGYFDLLLTI